jgi:hypothetical protein
MWFTRTSTILLVLIASLHGVLAQLNDHVVDAPAKTYDVLKSGRLVLTVRNVPGAITSTALPEVNSKPIMHPFLSATAHSANEENALHSILEKSHDFDDFLRRLSQRGYTIRERLDN